MTLREMNLRVFAGEPIPHVFFQPRFEPWFAWTRRFGKLPTRLESLELRDAYDLVGASMRTVHYYTGQPDPIEFTYPRRVKITEHRSGDQLRIRYETPRGELFETQRCTTDETWRTLEFPGKNAADVPALRYLLESRQISFNAQKFAIGADYVGHRGEPQFWVPKSPYFALAQQFMGFQDFIYALADHPEEMPALMDAVDASYDTLYAQLTASGSLKILNFGENVAMAYFSIPYYERYLAPWYEKRAGQLRSAGIFTHIHIDGYFKPLLPFLASMPFDGLEALTPKPQGDVTIEEIREHIGDKILLDGIPAVYFLDHYPGEELAACVEELIRLFHPRLVLGISDELPEASGEEGFFRMQEVAKRCLKTGAEKS